jgi:hypothetical protein
MDGGAAGAPNAAQLPDAAAGKLGGPGGRVSDGQLHSAAVLEGIMNWSTAADAAVAGVLQRDPTATWDAAAPELAPVLGQLRELLDSEGVTLHLTKKLAARAWDYPNKVRRGGVLGCACKQLRAVPRMPGTPTRKHTA